MFQERLHFFKSTIELVNAEVLVFRCTEKVFQHLRLLVQVFALLLVEVVYVHVIDPQIAFQLRDARLKELQVTCF